MLYIAYKCDFSFFVNGKCKSLRRVEDMELKKFLAANMAEAMIKVKNELGSDAVILQTRRVRRGGFLGIGSKVFVEVTAFREDDQSDHLRKKESTYFKESESTNELKSELSEIKSTLKSMNQRLSSAKISGNFSEPFEGIYDRLVEKGMKSEEASKIVTELSKNMSTVEAKNKEKLSAALRSHFEKMVKTEKVKFSPPKKAMLIGPTGVGKTTTLAKIAAMIKMKERQPLTIVTLDTYRIAAAQQMKTYADIMHIPFKVIYTPDEAFELSSKVKDEVLLIDTAGRSQKDEMKITEISSYVQKIKPDIVFLVVDATKKREDMEDVLRRFSVAAPTHFILTKVDETSSILGAVKALEEFSLPISFVTNGQNVPNDIINADEIDIPSLMIKEVLK